MAEGEMVKDGLLTAGHARVLAGVSSKEEQLRMEVKRDIDYGFEYGGVNISTAGSINNGSLLSSMRLIMELIWENRR